jgi:hypothetical protein
VRRQLRALAARLAAWWRYLVPRRARLMTFKGEGSPLKVVFRGDDGLFNDLRLILAFFGFSLVSEAAAGAAARNEADLAIREIPYGHAPAGEGARVQTLLDFVASIGPDFEAYVRAASNKQHRQEIAKSERAGLRLAQSRDAADLRRFYDEAMVPYARASHGDTAHVPSWEECLAKLPRGRLYIVRDADDGLLAGTFTLVEDGGQTLRLWRAGVVAGLLADRKRLNLVRTFMNAGMVRDACARGMTRVHFGKSPPLPTHGEYYYKTKWGARPAPSPDYPLTHWRGLSDRGHRLLASIKKLDEF